MELIPEQDTPITSQTTKNTISFEGKGSALLIIMLLNWVFTVFTLGLYYPWARVNKLKFMYGNTKLNNTAFIFHGTGNELFKGFLKFFGLLVFVYGFYFYANFSNDLTLIWLSFLLLAAFFIVVIPFALHGAFRYRLSRTSWSNIHLGYRGERGQLAFEFYVGVFLTIITGGIYYAWFIHKMRKYIIGNCRFGHLTFGYDGSGTDLFIINLKGYFLTFLTLGIYYFWYKKEYLNYVANYTYIQQNGNKFHLKGHIKGGSFFALTITNFFLVIFTFGIAIPWVIVRTTTFIIHNIELPSRIDFKAIEQTEDEFLDATGEDVLDWFDLGIV